MRSAGPTATRQAWEAGDPDAAAALYHEDCVFRSAPFREPQPPIEYTRSVYPEARAVDVHFGVPVEAGDRAAVEWWATLILTSGEEHALAGCSVSASTTTAWSSWRATTGTWSPGAASRPQAGGAEVRGMRLPRGLLAALVAAAVAIAFADSSIVVLALPELYGQFHTTIEGVSWVVTAYNAAVAVTALGLVLLVQGSTPRWSWPSGWSCSSARRSRARWRTASDS